MLCREVFAIDSLAVYKTDCLFLLVGTNPLPNFVASLLLAKTNGRIILLHSGGQRGTGKIAENLKRVITGRISKILVELREIDEKDGDRIAKKVGLLLKDINKHSTIGLNYTGGTKAMSVHVYQAITNRVKSAVFSYLDARTLSLLIDERDGASTKVIPVGQSCEVNLKEILSLHGYHRYSVKQVPVQPAFCCALAEIYSNIDFHNEWDNWLKKSIAEDFKTLPSRPEYRRLDRVIDTINELCEGNPSPALLAQKLGYSKLSSCKDYLEGKWLEEYTFCSLKQLANELGLRDIGFNLVSKKPRDFELDVVFVRGYQLFALSCKASSNKKYCKLGLFEAYTRARQVGGDEARIGLVCCYDLPGQLQREVEEEWFAEGRVKVFGIKDLIDLPAKLRDWIITVDNLEGGQL